MFPQLSSYTCKTTSLIRDNKVIYYSNTNTAHHTYKIPSFFNTYWG